MKCVIALSFFCFFSFSNTILYSQQTDTLISQAYSAYHQKHFVESSILIERALSRGVEDPIVLYNAACIFALSGRKEKAWSYLEKSISNGYSDVSHMKIDSDLVSLRNDKRWNDFLMKTDPSDSMSSVLDVLRIEMNNLAEHSYQYRIRPTALNGGNGSYLGYFPPTKLYSTAHGTYTLIISTDEIQINGSSIDSIVRVVGTVDTEGRLHDSKYSLDGTQWKELKQTIMVGQKTLRASLDMIINDINNIAAHAYQYYIRPISMAGGSGKYFNYKIPSKLSSNENVLYSVIINSERELQFIATSTNGNGTVSVLLNEEGRLGQWLYTGNFETIKK